MCGCNKGKGVNAATQNMQSNTVLGRLRNRYSGGIQPHVSNGRNPVPVPVPGPVPATDVSRWGPPLWKMMHILAFATSDSGVDVSGEWASLFQALQNELPCSVCRSHAQEWFNANPADSSTGIQQYLLNFHNNVNARRQVPLWSIQQIQSTYSVGGREYQTSLFPLLLSSVSMMPSVTNSLQNILASVS